MSYEQYGPVAVAAAQSAGIDPAVFVRQINAESGFNPSAGSPAGAQGIAQFMPATAQSLGIDPSDPVQALYGAAHLMRTYLDEFGNYADALVAYNAGPGAVGGQLPAETQTYLGNILGGQGQAPMAPVAGAVDPYNDKGWDAQRRVDTLGRAGYTYVSGNGPDAFWRNPLGELVPEAEAFKDIYPWADASGKVNQPYGIPSPTATKPGMASDFSLSPGQTRYDANGNPIASAPSINTRDPYALQTAQDAHTKLLLEAQLQAFNQNKYNLEAANGMVDAAEKTQQQLFQNKLNIAQLQNTIATNIGTLAANPGDLGKYVGTTLAMSRAQQGAAPKQGAYITDQSLAPLGSLLDLQNNLPQPPQPLPRPAFQPQPPLNLGALTAPVSSAIPQQAQTPVQSVLGAITPAYNPQTPDTAPNAVGGVGNPAAMDNQQLPAAANGGLEQSAYISGEKGPEINIPTKDGAIVLNADQAGALGINLAKLVKMAEGGVWDARRTPSFGPPATPQPVARQFVSDLAARLSNNLGLGGRAPGAVFASSPQVSPFASQAYGQLQQAYSGEPATQFDWLAKLLAPQGVNERVIGRSA